MPDTLDEDTRIDELMELWLDVPPACIPFLQALVITLANSGNTDTDLMMGLASDFIGNFELCMDDEFEAYTAKLSGALKGNAFDIVLTTLESKLAFMEEKRLAEVTQFKN